MNFRRLGPISAFTLAALAFDACGSSSHTSAGSSPTTTSRYPTASCAAAFAHPQGSTEQKLAAVATGCRNLDDLTAALVPYAPGHSQQKAAEAAGETKAAACLANSGPLCTSP